MRFYFSDINRARRAIKTAWIAGFVYSSLAMVGALYLLSFDPSNITSVLFALLYFAFTVGIYRKRSIAAIAMFFLALLNALNQVIISFLAQRNPFASQADGLALQSLVSLVILLPFIYCFWEGVRGVFSFRRLQRLSNQEIQ